MNKYTRCVEVNPAEIHTCSPQSKAQRLANEIEKWVVSGSTCLEAAAELRRLDALNAELVEALEEAVYEIADWGGYASEYFQNKHDLKGVINKFQTLVAKAKEQTK